MGVEALLTGPYGLLPKGTVGLLIGRGSATRQGIFVAPDVVDEGKINDSFTKWNFCFKDRAKACSIDFTPKRAN